MVDFDVIVVGGGIAGLGVAAQLQLSGLRTLLVDEHSRIGGRSTTLPYMEGWLMDLGHHCVNLAEKSEMSWLVRKVGKEIKWAKPIVGVQVYREGAWRDFKDAFSLSRSEVEDYEKMSKMIKGMSDEEIEKIDDVSLRDWLLQYTESESVIEMFGIIGMGYTTIPDPSEQSAGEVVWIHRENMLRMGDFVERPAGIPVGGAINLSKPLADALTENGGVIKLRNKATEIILEDQRAKGVKVLERGKTEEDFYTARIIVCAIPISRLVEILFTDENLSQLEPEWVKRMEEVKDQVTGSIGYITGLSKPIYAEPSFKCVFRLPRAGLPFQIFAPSNHDETVAPRGKMLVSMGAPAKPWQVTDEKTKSKLFEDIWADIEEMFPGIAELVEWNVPGTFIGVDGLERKPGLVGEKRPDVKAPGVEGLY
nr:NAD(P)/FAD-dependent oxidoreductase [Candidatus Bathyarchaeota archaeon]